jgi:hypothetical protein
MTYVVLRFGGLRTTPVALLIVIYPGIEIKAIEGHGLTSERNLPDKGPDEFIELVPVHAEIKRRIAQPDEPGRDGAEFRR